MFLSQYLFTKPNGQYFLRIRTPKKLKPTLGVSEIKRSLGTSDLALATKRALPYLDFLERMKAMAGISSILDGVGKFSVEELKIGDVEIKNLQVDPDKEGDVEAAIEFVNATIASQEGNSLPSNPKVPEQEKLTLKGLIKDYLNEKQCSGNWTQKTLDENTQLLNLLLRIIGDDITVDQLDHAVARKTKKILLQLPANVNKPAKYKNKTLEQIIAMGDKPRSITTVNKLLSRYSGLGIWLVDEGYLLTNYFANKGISTKKNKKDERAAYTDEQLLTLCKTLDDQKIEHDYQKWIPKIALYSGLRLNEICQLHLSDIGIDHDSGIYYFDINDDEEKTIKNENARRLVPIHPLLQDDLLGRVIRLRMQKKTRLFPEIVHDGNSYGVAPSKWFGRVREKLGWVNQTPKLDFHSFRHNTATFLQQQDIPEYRIAAILGHEVGKGETFNRYGKGFKLKTLKTDIESIYYPEIEPLLFPEELKNNPRR